MKKIRFTKHALDRAKERGIYEDTVTYILENAKSSRDGENIMFYAKDICFVGKDMGDKIIIKTMYPMKLEL